MVQDNINFIFNFSVYIRVCDIDNNILLDKLLDTDMIRIIIFNNQYSDDNITTLLQNDPDTNIENFKKVMLLYDEINGFIEDI